MIIRLLICLSLAVPVGWCADPLAQDLALLTGFRAAIAGDDDQAIAACRQIVDQGVRLRAAYGPGVIVKGEPTEQYGPLQVDLWTASQAPNLALRRRWAAVAWMAVRASGEQRFPVDYANLAGALADPDAGSRVRAWKAAGVDEPGRLMLACLAAFRVRPTRTLRSDGPGTAGLAVAWDWTWTPKGLGFWWTGALPEPTRQFAPVQQPVIVSDGFEGMFGSRSGGGRRRSPTHAHPLETWRLLTARAAGLDGAGSGVFPRAGLLRIGWPDARHPEDVDVPVESAPAASLTIGAPDIAGDGIEIAILPTPTPAGHGPTLSAVATREVLSVRITGGEVPVTLPRPSAKTLWMLAVSEGGRPTLATVNTGAEITVLEGDELPAGMAALGAGPTATQEAALDISELPPGRHRLWVGYGPVTLGDAFKAKPRAAGFWSGELVAGPISVEVPAVVQEPGKP